MLVVPPMAAGCSTAVLRAGQQTVFQLIAAAPIPWSKPAATKCSAKATRTAFRERSPVVPLLMGATACLLDGWMAPWSNRLPGRRPGCWPRRPGTSPCRPAAARSPIPAVRQRARGVRCVRSSPKGSCRRIHLVPRLRPGSLSGNALNE